MSQMGKICESLVNLGLFREIEDDLMMLIQRSFIDYGNKVEDQWHYFNFRNNHNTTDSDNEF